MKKDSFRFESATDVRKEWSLFFDKAVREKPVFIKRTRDNAVLADVRFISLLLENYTFDCTVYKEEDGTITLSSNMFDLVENGSTEEEAKSKMASGILEYAEDFYAEYEVWSIAPNRRSHIPYVYKALLLNDIGKIGDLIRCQSGENESVQREWRDSLSYVERNIKKTAPGDARRV